MFKVHVFAVVSDSHKEEIAGRANDRGRWLSALQAVEQPHPT